MLRIAICEDDPGQTRLLRQALDEYKTVKPSLDITVAAYDDGARLLAATDGRAFDLYLLDIVMPDLNGVELARRIRVRDADAPIIFLTASADYALEAFSVSAFHYLLKPMDKTCLFAALDRAVVMRGPADAPFFAVSAKERTVRVNFSEVISVELYGRALRVRADNGVYISKTLRVPFAEAVAPLMADGRFLHAHKSYMLNMARVRALGPRSFIMENGDEIPIPRHKYAEAKNKYFDYLSVRGVGLLDGGAERAR
jgi:DNA-binding LytR/AlgR family response regulator